MKLLPKRTWNPLCCDSCDRFFLDCDNEYNCDYGISSFCSYRRPSGSDGRGECIDNKDQECCPECKEYDQCYGIVLKAVKQYLEEQDNE